MTKEKPITECIYPSPGNPHKVARKLIDRHFTDQHGDRTLVRWRGQWWQWVGPSWVTLPESELRPQLWEHLSDAEYISKSGDKVIRVPWSPTRSKISDVLDALQAHCIRSARRGAPEWSSEAPYAPGEIIACQNALVHFPTRETIDHDPNFFNTVAVPFDFKPTARASAWEAFLSQVFGGDEESIHLIQEWFGYVISGRTDMQKMLLLIGPSRSGKGTIARVLQHLVGIDNTAGPTLASMSTNFGLQTLIGRYLAIVADARLHPRDSRQVVERLLSISGEDMLTIDRKYADPWTGTLDTRIMILSNELPRFGDASSAIVNRFMALRTKKSYLGKEDTGLTSKLLAELPGIFVWALDGLDRLIENGGFTTPDSMAEEMDTMRELSSPLILFAEEECAVSGDETEFEEIDHVYPRYRQWALDAGHTPLGKTQFYESLPNAVPRIRGRRPRRADGTRPRVFEGMRLRDSSPALTGWATHHRSSA